MEAEDFERAADLSAGLDAAGRDAGTAAAAGARRRGRLRVRLPAPYRGQRCV